MFRFSMTGNTYHGRIILLIFSLRFPGNMSSVRSFPFSNGSADGDKSIYSLNMRHWQMKDHDDASVASYRKLFHKVPVFFFWGDQGGRFIGLLYDLTVCRERKIECLSIIASGGGVWTSDAAGNGAERLMSVVTRSKIYFGRDAIAGTNTYNLVRVDDLFCYSSLHHAASEPFSWLFRFL